MALTVIYWFWESDLSIKITWGYFHVVRINTTVWMLHMNAREMHGENKERWDQLKNIMRCF